MPRLVRSARAAWLESDADGTAARLARALLAPLGLLLGLFFPLGMLRFGDASKPWYWAINGAFGVVASVLSLALSMEFGFANVALLGALSYLVAWGCLQGLEHAAEATGQEPPATASEH